MLLEAGANPNLHNKVSLDNHFDNFLDFYLTFFYFQHFYTPLHLALKRQHSTVALALLRSGAEFELEDSAGDRAIHYVARHNLVAVCQWLTASNFSSSTSLNSSFSTTTTTINGNSPSPSTNSTNSTSNSTSNFLQQPRCAVNSPNKSGLYPLHIAAKSGHIEIVRALCLAGSTIDPKDHDSMVPQICAIAQSHNDIADLLTRLLNGRQKVEEYIGQLSQIGMPPLSRLKLRIFGHCGSGKSTLIESMKCGYFSSWFRRSKATVVPVQNGSSNAVNSGYGGVFSPVHSMLRSKQGSISSLRSSVSTSASTFVIGRSNGSSIRPSVIQTVSGRIAATISAASPSQTPSPTPTPAPQLLSHQQTPNHYENATKGIDVQQVYIGGIGDLSIWEFSGNPVYYQLYDHFLADEIHFSCTTSLNAVVFRLSDPPEVQLSSITFWLAFIASRQAIVEPLLYGGRSSSSLRVILVATHADLASRGEMSEPEMEVHLRWLLEAVNRRFWTTFSIHPTIFMMDASVAGSAGMKALKAHLSAAKASVLGSPELPRTTRFLDSALTFLNLYRKASVNFPVLSARLFKEMIRSQINPLASEDHFRELLQQLVILGEVVYLKSPTLSSSSEDVILNVCDKSSTVGGVSSSVSSNSISAFSDDDQLVLCPRWLTCEVLGTLLPLKCNPSSYLHSSQLNLGLSTTMTAAYQQSNSSRINGILSIDEFQELYTEVDALDLLQLLESLQLCTQNDRSGDIEYEFPCFILSGDLEAALEGRFQYRENAVYHGLVYSRVGSSGGGGSLKSSELSSSSNGTILSSIFPRIQAQLRTELRHHPSFDVDELQNCFKYSLFSTCGGGDTSDTSDLEGGGDSTKLQSQSLVMIVSVDTVSDWIELRFCGPYELRREVFFFAAEMAAVVERTILEVAPGLLLRKAFFSPDQLKNSSPKEAQYSLYSSATLMRAMLLENASAQKSAKGNSTSTSSTSTSTSALLKRKVRTDDGLVEERLADVLTFGIVNLAEIGHPAYPNVPGNGSSSSGAVIEPTLVHELHSSNLSVLTKQQLCSLLDPPESIGRDWCMLGILLGMTDKLPKLDTTPTPTSAGNAGGFSWPKDSSSLNLHPTTLSPTSRVIEECIRNPSCTIKTLVEKLTELNRTDAVEVILQTGPLLRIHPLSSLPEEGAVYNDETNASSSSASHSLGISTSMSHTSSSNLSR